MTNFTAYADGRFCWPGGQAPCALGHTIIAAAAKREGDRASPIGMWPMRRVFYRPDREARPATALPCAALEPDHGWCDDPNAGALYNTLIKRPCAASHETLWRSDPLYDVLVVLGYNDAPIMLGMGSAIFLHLARADFAPTEGCVALARADLLAVLALANPDDHVTIAAS